MSESGPVFRGYRPSRFAGSPSDDGYSEMLRIANLERYIRRAQAGLPIFDDLSQSNQMAPPRRDVT